MITPDELDWMHHSTALTAAIVKDPPRDATPQYKAAHVKELKIMRDVLNYVQIADTFTGERAVYFESMLAHARLQIARYDGLLSEVQFLAQCKIIRDARDKTLGGVGNAR